MGYCILQAHDGKMPPDVHWGFQNTGKEDERTLVFIKECAERWGINIVWTEYDRVWGQDESLPHFKVVTFDTASRKGEPFLKMVDYYCHYRKEVKDLGPIIPNMVNSMCTSFLKIRTAKNWMQSLGYEEWDAIIGIRTDEPKRYARMMAANGKERWDNVMPMYRAGVIQNTVQSFWKLQPFDLGIDSDLGNCDLCFKKHINKIYRALIQDPELANFWIELEERTGERFRLDRPGYKEMKFVAKQMRSQIDMFAKTPDEEDVACGVCG